MTMKVDMNCPVELFQYTLPTEDFQAVSLLMFNLSEKVVASVQVTLVLYDSEGEELARQVQRVMGLNGPSKETFEMDVAVQTPIHPTAAAVTVEKVWFDDSFVWRRGNDRPIEYDLELIPPGPTLEMLRYLAGDDAVCYPKEENRLWICICGRANEAHEESCRRCSRTHDMVFFSYNRETVEAVTAQREKELEEITLNARKAASEKQTVREETFIKKKRSTKKWVIALSSVAAVAAIAVTAIFYVVPTMRYNQANALHEAGDFDGAKAAFAQMGDYKDAPELALKCDFDNAKAKMEEGTAESLAQAQTMFEALGDYKDAKDMAVKALLMRAQSHKEAGAFDEAAGLFAGHDDQAAQESRYLAAKAQMDAGNFDEAHTRFIALGDYEDAAVQAQECLYQPALKALEAKEYDTALALFAQLQGYEDADKLTAKAYYEKAEAFYALDDFKNAGENYLLCVDFYPDANDKAGACLYEQALAMMNKTDYKGAYDVFSKLGDYKEAMDKARECAYRMGISAMALESYAEALSYLEPLANYLDAADRSKEAKYQLALNAMAAGDYDAAAADFTALGDYKDSKANSQESSYLKAEKTIASGEYEKGIALYKALGDYKEAKSIFEQTSLEWAQALVTDTDYERAIAVLGGIGENATAKEMTQSIEYTLALDELANGDKAQAITQLEALGDYKDAKTLLNKSRYEMAGELQKSGDAVAAGNMYALCGDYLDAKTKSAQVLDAHYTAVKQSAMDAFEKGDYQKVLDTLGELDTASVPQAHADIVEYYNEANYKIANDLYNEGKPYEALPYYKRIESYKDVTKAKLSRNAYKILGTWENSAGVRMTFNADGTCVIGDEQLSYSVRNYDMNTGADAQSLTLTHHISRLTAGDLTLQDMRGNKKVTYRMQRVKE